MKIQIVKKSQKKAAPNGCNFIIEDLLETRK
jgi:hypothetical protein